MNVLSLNPVRMVVPVQTWWAPSTASVQMDLMGKLVKEVRRLFLCTLLLPEPVAQFISSP